MKLLLVCVLTYLTVAFAEEVVFVDGNAAPPENAQGSYRNILLIGGGSRGDVQPLLSVASYMHELGWRVCLCLSLVKSYSQCSVVAGPEFKELIESIGCKPVALGIMYSHLLHEDTDILAAYDTQDELEIFKALVSKFTSDESPSAADIARELKSDTYDVVLGCSTEWYQPIFISQLYDVPSVLLNLQMTSFDPLAPSCLFNPYIFPEPDIDMYLSVFDILGEAFLDSINEHARVYHHANFNLTVRDMLALQNGNHPYIRQIHAYSKVLSPPSKGNRWINPVGALLQPPQDDDHAYLGFPKEIRDFLAASDEVPVFIGWGSMTTGVTNCARLTRVAVGALKKLNFRGIINRGWQKLGLEHLDEADEEDRQLIEYAEDNILFITKANYNLLFRECKALLIHGGAGTSHSAAQSGAPTLFSPLLFDQPYFASQFERLGNGKLIPGMLIVTADDIAQGFTELLDDPETIQNAKDVAQRIRAEDGLAATYQKILESMAEYVPGKILEGTSPLFFDDTITDKEYLLSLLEPEYVTDKMRGIE